MVSSPQANGPALLHLTSAGRKEFNDCVESLRAKGDQFDYQEYRDKVYEKLHKGTCEWIKETSQYKEWMGSENGYRLLWIHGAPGSGKSVMSAFMSRILQSETPVAYFFFDDKDENLRTISAALKILLTQILMVYPKSHTHFLEEKDYERNKEKTVWKDGMLWRVFRRIAADRSLGAICLILDAIGRFAISRTSLPKRDPLASTASESPCSLAQRYSHSLRSLRGAARSEVL